MDPTLDFHESNTESENVCQEIKNTAIQESIAKMEWDNTKIPEVSGQKPKELAYQVNEMQVQKLEKCIFIGDSSVTSHMTSDMTGLYNLQKIWFCHDGKWTEHQSTHKGLVGVICVQRHGSTAKDTWEIKVVPQLNHDLFSFTRAMKNGWQMNGRWKKNGIERKEDMIISDLSE